jgi:hypothetical protein
MSSKRSAKRSPASQGCQENKGAAQRYLEPAFLRELRIKAEGYLVSADRNKSSEGEWFPKDVIEDPLFYAIVYLRRRHENERKLAERLISGQPVGYQLPKLLDQLLDPEDPEPAMRIVDVVRQGNIGKLKDIVKFCELFESKYQRMREEQSDPLPLEYYAARAALGFLTEGTIPLKKRIREAAFKERAIAELPVMYQVGTKEVLPILQEAGESNEMLIDPEPVPDPELDQTQDVLRQQLKEIDADPSDHYVTDQDEPEHDPIFKMPAEEKKPTLRQQRAKLIADRIKELRREHTPQVWATTWARVFEHLGLKDLPRC